MCIRPLTPIRATYLGRLKPTAKGILVDEMTLSLFASTLPDFRKVHFGREVALLKITTIVPFKTTTFCFFGS